MNVTVISLLQSSVQEQVVLAPGIAIQQQRTREHWYKNVGVMNRLGQQIFRRYLAHTLKIRC